MPPARQIPRRVHGGTKSRESTARVSAGLSMFRRGRHPFESTGGTTARGMTHDRTPTASDRRDRAVARRTRRRAGEIRIPRRLVDLCRLDALGLSGRLRDHGQMGRQVRHRRRDRADQRLHRVDQPVHRRRLRRRLGHQHGHAVDPLGVGRRHHRADRGRLFQRQRCRHHEGRGHARGSRRQAGEPGRAVGVASSTPPMPT